MSFDRFPSISGFRRIASQTNPLDVPSPACDGGLIAGDQSADTRAA
jgi:hypothetical protein